MTRKKKITATTDNSEWKAPKKRKPRKPMTEEQRAAASERLAKAREVRAEKNPDYGKAGVAKNLHSLPDDHPMSPATVKKWIKTQKALAASERAGVRQNVKGAEARLASHEGYIRNMQTYLRNGDWVDMFYGEHQQGKIRNRCVALAYYWYGPNKGKPKRDVNTFYPDLGCVWTEEMNNQERGIKDDGRSEPESKPTKQRRKRTVGRVKKKSKNTR